MSVPLQVDQLGRTATPIDATRRSLEWGCGAPLPSGFELPVHEIVSSFAATQPDALAVECDGSTLTYSELDACAARLASRLRAAGLGRGSNVALLFQPSIEMVVAVLGILRSGAAYVPLDPEHPDPRIAALVADARVGAVVVAQSELARAAQLGTPVFEAVETASEGPVDVDAPQERVAATDPAYLIYTSGSTGEPKGVVVEHGQLAATTMARRLVYLGSPVFLLVSPLAFDSSVAGVFGTLASGGRLVVATTEEVRDPEQLVRLVHRHRVNRLLCIPGLYGVLLDAAARVGMDRLAGLETVIVAGEVLPEELVDRHLALRGAEARLVNEYGPTESTVWASYQPVCGPGAARAQGPVPIGRPVPGVRLYVLDGEGRPVQVGGEGELVIGGALVARGYFGRPDATDLVFVPDPFTAAPGARMYRTGDIARWTDDGTLKFLGRRDRQVKIRGHRVELEAVEAALRKAPGVREAAVVLNNDSSHVLGFVTMSPGVAADGLREQVAACLPAAMVPSSIHALDRFPTTVNGKVDRAALSAAHSVLHASPAPVRGLNETAGCVAAAWAEVLQLAHVPTEANFFDLGGNSLSMFRLQDALEQRTGIRPSVVALFRHTTVAAQAALIRDGGSGPDEAPSDFRAAAARRAAAMRARRERAAPRMATTSGGSKTAVLHCELPRPEAAVRLVCFPHAGGSAAFFRGWGAELPALSVHAVRYPGRAERLAEPLPTDLREVAAEIAEALTGIADRPLALFGHSMGAVVALETARALQARGVQVAHLFASGSRDGALPSPEDAVRVGEEEDDAATVQRLLELGGTDAEVAADPAFQELILPYVRADGRMFHAYEHRAAPVLQCPVTTIVGDADGDADSRPWSTLTSEFRQQVVPGDHFYLRAVPPLALVADAVLGEQAGRPSSTAT